MYKDKFLANLYKNKLNEKTLVDILPYLKSKTVELLEKDLDINTQSETLEEIDNNTVYIFTDGACKNNGKKSAIGAYGIYFTEDTNSEFYNFNTVRKIEEPTNQKAELSAIKYVFKIIYKNQDLFRDKNIIICTDSMYSINCIEKWSAGWLKNDWKNSKGEAVKNQEIIKQILELKSKLNIKINFKHVFSHLKEPNNQDTLEYKLWNGNNIVDAMINKFLEN